MTENLFEARYDITKKSKFRNFYDSYKIFIYSFVLIFFISLGSYNYFLSNKEKKKILISENYIQAKIYLENGKKNEATDILKNIILADDPVYSTLGFFLILNQDLIVDQSEISSLFNHLLENNKFGKEVRNLLIFKKALYNSNFVDESVLLEEVKPLISSESLWKPHALLLLGDYFLSKKENLKAKEFYLQILNTRGLQNNLYEHARSKLASISND